MVDATLVQEYFGLRTAAISEPVTEQEDEPEYHICKHMYVAVRERERDSITQQLDWFLKMNFSYFNRKEGENETRRITRKSKEN